MAKQTNRAWALSNGKSIASLRHVYRTRNEARKALRFAKAGSNKAGYTSVVPIKISKVEKGRADAFALADQNGINVRYIFGTKKQAKTVMSIVNEQEYLGFQEIVPVTIG